MRIDLPRVFAVLAAVIGLQVLGSLPLAGQASKPPGKKSTAPAPKWDARMLQAYFADVVKEVGPGQPGGGVRQTPSSGGATGATPAVAAGVAAGGGTWSKLIDAETLESEIKTAFNSLTVAVESSGKFKSQHYKQARRSYSLLATLFGVVSAYDGDVKWKASAAGMRDGLAKAGFNCKVGTEQSYSEAKKRYEDLQGLLTGGGVKTGEGEPNNEWAKVADLEELMKRMDEAGQTRLTPWVASESEFKANKDKVLHEAQILAVMSQVIQHESYVNGGDEVYLKYANQLQKGVLSIVEGAKGNNYDLVRTGASEMAKACDKCHGDYK